MKQNPQVVIRNDLKPGDAGYIIYLHGYLYSKEYGFDSNFEPYVAIPLAEFVMSHTDREKIWIVEREKEIVGSVAIVRYSDQLAQLRWLLLHPKIRGFGIGKNLVEEGIAFCRDCGYSSLFLWTVDILKEATQLYQSIGFKLTEQKTHEIWGIELTEQRYELVL